MKKFYENEVYIKMCEKAEELQQNLKIKYGDCIKFEQGEIAFVGKYDECDRNNSIEIVAPDLDMPYDGEDKYAKIVCKIYRQDQLQEMLEKEYKTDGSTFFGFVWEFELHNINYIYNVDKEENPTIVLLLCVMSLIYNKVWVPSKEEWVSSI